jgi:hypothetical protein
LESQDGAVARDKTESVGDYFVRFQILPQQACSDCDGRAFAGIPLTPMR